jgi:predicted flavoprotein YhiN
LNSKSILSVLLFLAVIAFSWFSYSVLIPASPMPITSPTFELRSDTTNLLYIREVVLVLSGTSVTQVQVTVFNNKNRDQNAAVTVQIYDWSGNLIFQGSRVVTVRKESTATATVNLSPSVPHSSVGMVVASVQKI